MSNLAGKRVLVTGGFGFLGSRVVDKLRMVGALPTAVGRGATNLLVRRDVLSLIHNSASDVVIHCAARCGGIGANAARPADFFTDNLRMGMNVIEACTKRSAKLVMIGTVCSYPKNTPVPFKESDLWKGYPEETNAPYGIAKRALLTMCQAYRQQYGLNAIFLMPANLYGPGDNFDSQTSHVIPAIIRKCVEARSTAAPSITLWGDGSPTREFLYVEDAATAIVLAAERYDGAEPVNIGTGREISIGDLAHMIKGIVGYRGAFLCDPSKPNGQMRRVLDTSRAEQFGFRASTDLEIGLIRTIDWYCANAHE